VFGFPLRHITAEAVGYMWMFNSCLLVGWCCFCGEWWLRIKLSSWVDSRMFETLEL